MSILVTNVTLPDGTKTDLHVDHGVFTTSTAATTTIEE